MGGTIRANLNSAGTYREMPNNIGIGENNVAPRRPTHPLRLNSKLQTSVWAPVGAQGLHAQRAQRVQAMPTVRGGRGCVCRRRVATPMLGPVDVAAGRPHGGPWVVGGRRGGGGGGRGGGGGGSAGRGAAGGQGVRPPVPARCAPQAAVGAMTRTLVLPRVVARLRHGPRLLPPGVSEVHLLHAARGAEAVVVRPQRAEVVTRYSLLLGVARRCVRVRKLEERFLSCSTVRMLLHFPQSALGGI